MTLSGGVNEGMSRRNVESTRENAIGGFYPAPSITMKRKRGAGSTEGWYGGGEALNPSLIAYIGPSLTFTIQGTVLAA